MIICSLCHESLKRSLSPSLKGFVEPVNKCGLTYLNGELIERQVSLEHKDVVTVVKRSFRFYYPSSSKFYLASESAASFEDNMVRKICRHCFRELFSFLCYHKQFLQMAIQVIYFKKFQ